MLSGTRDMKRGGASRIQAGRSPGSRFIANRRPSRFQWPRVPVRSPFTVTSSRGIFTRFPFHRGEYPGTCCFYSIITTQHSTF